MAYEDYENEEETEDEEEKDESSESSETQAPVNTPAPTPANNQPIDTAIKAGQEAQQPTAPAQQPATPAQTSTLPNDSPYGNGGQGADSATPSQNQGQQQSGKYDNLTDAQIDYLVKNINQLSEEDKKTVQALADQRKQAGSQAQTGNNLYNSLYGRTGKEGYGKDSYVYSYSAKQLQNDINKQIIARNKEAVKTGHPENVMSLIKEDGLMGYKTKEAMDKLGMDTSMYSYVSGDSSSAPAPSSSGSSASEEASSAALATPRQSMTGNSMSAALADAAKAAPAAQTPATTTPNPSTPSNANLQAAMQATPLHDDAWYADQYEKITGSAPRTDILSPERIKDFVDGELAKQANQPVDIDEAARAEFERRQAEEQARTNEINANRDAAFTPRLEKDLKGGKSIEQIIGEGDKSFNRWLEDNWDDLSYTYNLSGNPFWNGENTEQRNPINYDALSDELFQMDRNDWYQRPGTQQNTANNNAEQLALYDELENAYRNSVVGENGYTGQQQVEFDQMDRNDSYNPTWTMPNNTPATANQREPINYNAMSDELNQMDRNDWYQRPESQQTSGLEREPINYNAMADELAQLERNDWYQRPETPQAPERTPLEYSDAFIRQEEMKDAYSPYADYSGSMASDDVQSSSTTSPEEQDMLAAYEAAMQSAGRARDIFQGLPNEAEQIQQTREQWDQNMRTALENQFNNPYMQQFKTDFEQLKQQFPNYSDTALMDMVLVGEEMRNGQSSYYKWLANSL